MKLWRNGWLFTPDKAPSIELEHEFSEIVLSSINEHLTPIMERHPQREDALRSISRLSRSQDLIPALSLLATHTFGIFTESSRLVDPTLCSRNASEVLADVWWTFLDRFAMAPDRSLAMNLSPFAILDRIHSGLEFDAGLKKTCAQSALALVWTSNIF